MTALVTAYFFNEVLVIRVISVTIFFRMIKNNKINNKKNSLSRVSALYHQPDKRFIDKNTIIRSQRIMKILLWSPRQNLHDSQRVKDASIQKLHNIKKRHIVNVLNGEVARLFLSLTTATNKILQTHYIHTHVKNK